MQSKGRYLAFAVFIALVLGAFVVRLFDMQFVHGEENLTTEQKFSRKPVRLTGPRGKIVDTNGLPLAYNKTSYNVDFVRDPYQKGEKYREAYTKGIIKAIDIIEKNGGKTISTFAIKRDEAGEFGFNFGNISKEAADKRESNWRRDVVANKSQSYTKKASPEQLYWSMRDYYYISRDTSYEQAVKILSIWQEVCFSSFSISYNPITIATDVNFSTVAEIEMYSNELPGMQISQSRTRVYPNKSLAAHIVGYMGRMLDETTIVEREKQGYSRDDLVGISGIESTMEYELSGNIADRTGTRVVEVDSRGKVVRELESDNRAPKAGNNVMLTIDSKLQKRLEDALADNIAYIKSEQETAYRDDQANYDQKISDPNRNGKQLQLAKAGGAIVMDVRNGDILAMASYPSFDLNLFTGGLSDKDMDVLKENNALFNYAISSRATPGSVFKMCTGLAGLMEGSITLADRIDDQHEYTVYVKPNSGEHGPTCWERDKTKHAQQDLVAALKNSCNYYFFTTADRMKIDKLNKWADLLGLSDYTLGGMLPGETKGQIGNQKTLYDPDSSPGGIASLVYTKIFGYLKDACEYAKIVGIADEKYDAVTRELMQLVGTDTQNLGPDIRAILKNELNIPSKVWAEKNLVGNINSMLTEIKWNPNNTIVTGIGQGVTMITPIELARYVAALVNGGEVYQARIVKSTITPDGEVRTMPSNLVRKLDINPSYLAAIKEGMGEVVSPEEGGTAGAYFKDFKYPVGGKTGTAQVSKIDLENNSWFVAFAPFDKPEIAVVVYIPNGYKGGLSSQTAKEVIQYYLDSKSQKETPTNMPSVGNLVK